MKSRIASLVKQPATGGLSIGDTLVVIAVVSLLVVILYPVFAHA